VLVLDRQTVEELLDAGALVDAVAAAMADVSAGRASMPPRVAAEVGHAGILAAMPGYSPTLGVLCAKLVSVFPGNAGTDVPTHQGLVAVFDPATGTPVALLDGEAVTAARTAAGSALSVRLLARPDARVLAVLGTGVQAGAHARAVCAVHDFSEVRVAGRDAGKAARLAADLATAGVPARGAASLPEAMRGADVVCAATSSREPVVRREWVEPGTHITSVGFVATGREVDDATIADSLVVVEDRAAVLAPFPSGSFDLIDPVRRGVISAEHVSTEIGDLLLGRHPGRTSGDQITLYKSVGVAVQDAAAAAVVLNAAERRGMGRRVAL
jgi:ornithine cyclodeaminase